MTSADLPLILQTFADVDTASLINSGLTMAGLKGKITLSSPSVKLDTDVLELTQGYVFNNIFPAFSIKPASFVHPKIVCIDGLVENVSEIHHLLESAAKSKETIVAFFRGLSEEVSHTLKVNYDRGTVSFIPIVVKFDIDGANLLKDIALVSRGDVVSSLKGNLISSIEFDSLPRIDVASVSGSEVIIENKSVAGLVDLHIAQLQKKILSAENEATVEALTKRIQRLGTYQVSVHLADNKEKNKRSFMIDRCLRAIKCASTYGIAQLKDRAYPASTISSADFYCQQFHETMNNMGTIII
jgi:chaperonin GroEL (HSP60 family)